MTNQHVLVFISVLTASLSVIFVLRILARKTGILMTDGIARVGGIGVAAGVFLSLFLGTVYLGAGQHLLFLSAVATAMLVFGVMDDLREKSVVQKIILQAVCAGLLISMDIRTHIMYFNDWVNILITFVWIIGITNAFNLLDVIDGLSSGVAVIVAAAFLVLSFQYPNPNAQVLSLGLLAATAGFLFYNLPPATVYLGNAGSHFLGFVLAALALEVHFAVGDNPVALITPILVLALPIFETGCLIFFRTKKKILPFHKSKDHAAFRLATLGFSLRGVLGIMLGFSVFCALAGVILSTSRFGSGVFLVGGVILVSSLFFKVLLKADRNGHAQQ